MISGKNQDRNDPRPGVDFVGWYDDEFLYLLPDAAFVAAARFCRDTGEGFPTSLDRLKQNLRTERISACDPIRCTATVRIRGQTKRVLKLNIQAVETALGLTGITADHRYHRFDEEEIDTV